jgi:prepilin-type N-terminal cleavage/methylation domain-containing protein
MLASNFVDYCDARARSAAAPAGFTLVEILLVVIILGIASALLVPQIGERSDLQAASAARVIMSDLLYAQNHAIATQQYQYVTFNVPNQKYTLYSGTSSGPGTILTHPVYLTNYVMNFGASGQNSFPNVTLVSANFGNNQPTIAFDSQGVPYYYTAANSTNTAISGLGVVQISSGNYSLTINVAQDTGDISVQ